MGFVRRHPVVVTLLAGVLVVFSILAASAVSVWRAAHTDEAKRIDSVDIILVMGAAQYGGIPSPVFRGRLEHAALLYRKEFADRLMVLGAGQPGDELTESEAGGRYLSALGIPDDDILYSPHGSTTQESLESAVEVMEERGLDSAFLVSDPWHNLRIRRIARDLGIEGYVSATWHSAAKSQATRLNGYVRETLAYLFYRLTGR